MSAESSLPSKLHEAAEREDSNPNHPAPRDSADSLSLSLSLCSLILSLARAHSIDREERTIGDRLATFSSHLALQKGASLQLLALLLFKFVVFSNTGQSRDRSIFVKRRCSQQ